MWPNPQFHAYLVTFTDEILNGKLHSLCSGWQRMDFFLNHHILRMFCIQYNKNLHKKNSKDFLSTSFYIFISKLYMIANITKNEQMNLNE